MIPAAEAARVISRHRGDAIAVASSRLLDVWSSASQHRAFDLDLTDCPDRVAAVAMGLSLALPYRRVLALDSDATLRSNVSSLATVGILAPANLVHFLFRDTGHHSTAGAAIPRLDTLDFNAMAKSAGYAASFTFNDIEEMDLALEDILNAPGPQFVTINVYYDNGPGLRIARPMAQAFALLKKTLSAVV